MLMVIPCLEKTALCSPVCSIIKKRVPEVLTLVGLAEKYKSFPKELSGGEQQRVAVARAIVNRPDILLADEPTGNLDPKTSESVFLELLSIVRETGLSALIATGMYLQKPKPAELRAG